MQPSHNVIQRLPETVVQQSRASTHITDFSVAVAELVQNAIDADSRSVSVAVSSHDWSISVTDDGYGITAASMQLLGQRFCTSKPGPARGEALNCLAQVSSLQITSRARGTFETYTKAIGSATNTSLQLCTTPRQRHGTTATLANFLHSQPVRRLQSKGHAAALKEVKTILQQVMLPHPAVELLLQQTGSQAVMLHMPKDRTVSSSCQQLFQTVQDHTCCISTLHKQGWQLTGCVATPPATFQSANQQLLYLNKRPITCNVLQHLLRDWFVRSLRSYQANPNNDSSRNASLRAPEPGYVLLITCPASAVVLQRQTALHFEAHFSASMAQLVDQLQEGIGPAWGTMPPAWCAAAAPEHSKLSGPWLLSMGSSHSGGGRHGAHAATGAVAAAGAGSAQQRSQLMQQLMMKQAQLQPVHGLQLASRTRSLAGRAADTQGDCGGFQQHNAAKVEQSRHKNKQQVELMQCKAADTSDYEFSPDALCTSSCRYQAVNETPAAATTEAAAAAANLYDADYATATFSNLEDTPAHLHTTHVIRAWMHNSSSSAPQLPESVSVASRRTTAAGSAVAASACAHHDLLSSPGLLASGMCGDKVCANNTTAVTAAAVAAATHKKTAVPGARHDLADWLEDDFSEVPSVAALGQLSSSSPSVSLMDTFAAGMVDVSNSAALLSQYTREQLRRQHAPLQLLQPFTASKDLSVNTCSISLLAVAGHTSCHAHHSLTQQQQQQRSWLLAAEFSPSYSPKPASTEQAVAAGLLEDSCLANMHAGTDLRYDCTVPSPACADCQHHLWEGGSMQQPEEHAMLWEVSQQHVRCELKLCRPAAVGDDRLQPAQEPPILPEQSSFGVSPLIDHRPCVVAGPDSPGSPGFESLLDLQELQQKQEQHIKQHAQQQQEYTYLLGSSRQQPQPSSMCPLRNTQRYQVSASEELQQLLLSDFVDGRSWQQYLQHGEHLLQQPDDEDLFEQQHYQHVPVAYSSRLGRSAVAVDRDIEDQWSAGYDSDTNLAPLLTHNRCQALHLQLQLHQQPSDAAPVHELQDRSMHQSSSAKAVAASPSTTLLQDNEDEELERLFLHHSSTVPVVQQHQQQQLRVGSLAAGNGIEQGCRGLGAAACYARTALQQQQQEQQQRCVCEDLHWRQQHQHATVAAHRAKGMYAIQPLQTAPFGGFGAGDTPTGFAVYNRTANSGPPAVVSRRQGAGGGCSNKASSFLGNLQQLSASPQELSHSAQQALQPAAAAAADQESVGLRLFKQQPERHAKRVPCSDNKGTACLGYRQHQHSPPHEQQQQQKQEHRQLLLCPTQSEETVQQQHGQEVDHRDQPQLPIRSTNAQPGRCQQVCNQQQQGPYATRAQHPRAGEAPAEVLTGTRRITAAAAPLLQPFQERLLRSASPQCKRQRRFAVSDSRAAAVSTIFRRHVRHLQPEGIGVSKFCATGTDAAAAIGDNNQHGCRLPAPHMQPGAEQQPGAAAQGVTATGASDAEQQLQPVHAANTAGIFPEVPHSWKTALQDISNVGNVAPTLAHTNASHNKHSNHSKGYADTHARSTTAGAPKHNALTARLVAVGSNTAAADQGGVLSSAWQQMQQHWKQQQQQHDAPAQKRRKLSAEKGGLPGPPSKQLQQSRLPFLPLSAATPADKTVYEAGSAAGVQPPHLANVQQLVQAEDTSADAAAVPSAAVTTKGVAKASADVAAAQLGEASVSALTLRSSLSKPKSTAAQVQTSTTCGGNMPSKPSKRVRFSNIPLSSSSTKQPGCESAQQQHIEQQRGPSNNSRAGGPCQAELPTMQTHTTAVCTKTAASGARTSTYFESLGQNEQMSSITGGCSSKSSTITVTATGDGLLAPHAVANTGCLPLSILSIDELCKSSSSSTTALVPDSVTRQQLQHAHVLTQVANKMIVVRCGSVLLAIDQHAADERVRLEALQHKLALQLHQQDSAQHELQQGQSLAVALTALPPPARLACASKADAADETKSRGISGLSGTTLQPRLLSDGENLLQTQKLTPGVSMLLSMTEARSLLQYRQQVEAWGWKVLLHDSTDGAAAGQDSGVATAAMLQQAPALCGVQLGALDLQMYLHQLLETCGCTQQPPPGVVRTLKSKACRGAIMFGMALSQQQCVQLVGQLGATQLCFCCAHGRPTMAPVVELVALAVRMKQQSAARSLGQAAAVAAAQQGSHGRIPMQQLSHKLRRLVKCH